METVDSKRISLFMLSSAAAALGPQALAGSISFTDLSGSNPTVGFGGADLTSFAIDLPGINDIQVSRATLNGLYAVGLGRGPGVDAGAIAWRSGNSNSMLGLPSVARAAAGPAWGAIGIGTIGEGHVAAHRPGSTNPTSTVSSQFGGGSTYPGESSAAFQHEYVAFRFKDSTAGDATRYGWIQLSAAVSDILQPSVTIEGYAFDTTGAEIAMGATGAVPEPGQMMAAVAGALLLGASGLRSYRRLRPQPDVVPAR